MQCVGKPVPKVVCGKVQEVDPLDNLRHQMIVQQIASCGNVTRRGGGGGGGGLLLAEDTNTDCTTSGQYLINPMYNQALTYSYSGSAALIGTSKGIWGNVPASTYDTSLVPFYPYQAGACGRSAHKVLYQPTSRLM